MKKRRFDIGKFWRGRKQPASVRRKHGRTIKKEIQEGEFKIWNKGRHESKEHRENLRRSNILTWKNPALRRKMSLIKKKQYLERPLLDNKIDHAITRWWREHPNIRKIRSEKMKQELIKHPLALKKFLEYGKNPLKGHLKTKQGFIVRSKGELAIANLLFDSGIKSFYEAKPLQLEGNPCVPDFWLPGFRTYIEFYGGYPGSWKKKVLKNRLYKKYKIPCVFITPEELEDLNYYLLKEIKEIKK